MDPITLLKEDHQKVQSLFQQFERMGQGDTERLEGLAQEIFKELDVHSRIEEEIFYPAVREKGDEQEQEVVAESLEEHHEMDTLINELKRLSPQDEQYKAKFTVLIENVRHHIQEEEEEMLPEAEQLLGGEMDQLGERMMQRKQQLMEAVS